MHYAYRQTKSAVVQTKSAVILLESFISAGVVLKCYLIPPAGTWAMAGLVPGAVCLLLTPALMYVLYPPEVKDTPDAPAKVGLFRTAGQQ